MDPNQSAFASCFENFLRDCSIMRLTSFQHFRPLLCRREELAIACSGRMELNSIGGVAARGPVHQVRSLPMALTRLVSRKGRRRGDDGVDVDDEAERVATFRERYIASLCLLARWVLAASDHATDAAVLWDLISRGHPWIAAVGLAIDLLPGPVTVAHFLR